MSGMFYSALVLSTSTARLITRLSVKKLIAFKHDDDGYSWNLAPLYSGGAQSAHVYFGIV